MSTGNARKALSNLRNLFRTGGAHPYDYDDWLNAVETAVDQRDDLLEACEGAEQTLRNLATGSLTGDLAQIARNEAVNLQAAIASANA